MSKYELKANDLLARLQALINKFEIHKGQDGWPDYYVASSEITDQYPDILIDVQTLFFCDSPSHPLYVQVMKLNERKDKVLSRYSDEFSYSDFVTLKNILLKYLEYRAFLEAKD